MHIFNQLEKLKELPVNIIITILPPLPFNCLFVIFALSQYLSIPSAAMAVSRGLAFLPVPPAIFPISQQEEAVW